MKNGIYLLGCVFLIFGCHSKADVVQAFIPGTYTRFSDHEMRTEYDTLRIERLRESGNYYRIVRSLTFQKKLDGKAFPWQSTKEEWSALFDELDQVLKEFHKGHILVFIPEENKLLVSTTEYKKIK
jgi:hypothetical protein